MVLLYAIMFDFRKVKSIVKKDYFGYFLENKNNKYNLSANVIKKIEENRIYISYLQKKFNCKENRMSIPVYDVSNNITTIFLYSILFYVACISGY